ncbi:glycine zipper 2TM domain-containing protein [Limnohabitans sp.]|uniref:glycine zipper 2TM domain-containing protein n=1 Tax=Limnohabitans sp. TaxID=1907725 RepID=UPI00286F2AC9|nr:glycine zipper 2TM domain-containing protein [Limnohabitans sp.]
MKNTSIQKTCIVGLIAVLGTFAVQAQEVGKVISSTPIIQQVAVPRQVCNNQQVVIDGQKSGAGAAMGAIAGGAIGNQIGNGSGRALATMAGIFGGAIMGDKIEGPSAPEVRHVQNCSQQMFYENRTMAYNVVYEYAGKQYTVQMPQDPGPTVRLQITPMAPAPANAGYGVPPAGSAPRY